MESTVTKNQNQLESFETLNRLLTEMSGDVASLASLYTKVLKAVEAGGQDELSQCMRRNTFFNKWNQVLQALGRTEETGLILIDLDHFKKINDTYGHPVGDEVIRRIGELLREFESPRCLAGRLGGEEFALAVVGSQSEVNGIAELVRRRVEATSSVKKGEETVHFTASLGVGMTQLLEECLSEATASQQTQNTYERADQALYAAKKEGRNQVKVAS
jgi:diguanylate cyclase (GGDEF)-like protein